MRHRALAGASLLLACTTVPSMAQSPLARPNDDGVPTWVTAWSPLAPLADRPRGLPTSPAFIDLLFFGPTRIGAFWTHGNPGGLARALRDSVDRLADFGVRTTNEEGDYRRPLDPHATQVIEATGLAWQPLGRAGAGIGRVVVEQAWDATGAWGVAAQPYGSSPFVVTDSTEPDMRRARARLEGAIGWRLAKFGIGLAPAIDVSDHRSERSGVPRTLRTSTPAVGGGIVYELGRLGLTAGVGMRAQWGYETVSITPLARSGTVYELEGFSEPDPKVFPELSYYRRAERNGVAVAGSLSGILLGAAWTLGTEHAVRREALFSDPTVGAPQDRWRASANRLTGALVRALGAHTQVSAAADWLDVRGAATRADLTGDIVRVDDEVLALSADVRRTRADAWSGGLRVSTTRDAQRRHDFLARRASEIIAWAPGVAAELAHPLGPGTDASLGLSWSAYAPASRVSDPAGLGPVYRRLIAPELSLRATGATTTAGAVALRRRLTDRTRLWARLHGELLSPGSSALPLLPDGRRMVTGVVIGATISG